MSSHIKAFDEIIGAMPNSHEEAWKMYVQVNQLRESRNIEKNELNQLVQKYPSSKLAEWVRAKNAFVCSAVEKSDALRKYVEKLAPSMKRSTSTISKMVMEHIRESNNMYTGREDVISFSKNGKVLSIQFIDPHDLEAIKNRTKKH